MTTLIQTSAHSESAPAAAPPSMANADKWLHWTLRFWFGVTVIGQWVFTWYILKIYWVPVSRGESEHWNNLFTEFNWAFMAHVGLAAAVFLGGPLQFIPQIRARYPRFHHWNGRIYLLFVTIAISVGLYIMWFHSTAGSMGIKIGTSISALLAAYFGWQSIRFAIARNFSTHRRYALRLFITAAASWFFRIQLMLWMTVSGGRGLNPETFVGPATTIISFTQYLIPLLVLEIFFAIQKSKSSRAIQIFSAVLAALTVPTAIGLYITSIGMWFPDSPEMAS